MSAQNATSDPLLEQAEQNRLTDGTPAQSGSAPLTEHERDQGKDAETGHKNVAETLMERAFDKDGHQQEIGGAGVGTHAQH